MDVRNKYLNMLFDEDDFIQPSINKYETESVALKSYIWGGKEQWVALNPLKPYDRKVAENVTKHRNLLIEFDNIPKDEQLQLIANMEMPYTTRLWTGSKSYHFIISLENPLSKEEYKLTFKWLSNILGNLNDPAMSSPNILTRIPGGINEKTGNEQVLEFVAEKRLPNEKLTEYLNRYPQYKPIEQTYDKKKVYDGGWSSLNPLTRNFINTGSSGVNLGRHTDLKLSAIDVFNAGYDSAEAYNMLSNEYLKRYEDKSEDEVERIVNWVWSNI
jgi:hypothetical protein